MRVSQHSGRSGSAKHNDRSFLEGKSEKEKLEMAPHIRLENSPDNDFWCCYKNMSFKEAELRFYQERYSQSLEKTNSRYRAEGHPERCKTIEDLYTGKLTRPEEVIIQLGDKNSGITLDEFNLCFHQYLEQLLRWNSFHGDHMHLLSISVHMDESSPHAHIRRVWDYIDKDGVPRLGQNRALEAAGVPLPDETKTVSRYNNRKMTFDAQMRESWQLICKSMGYEIETQPRPNMRHKEKAEYIADQLQAEIDELSKQRNVLQQQVESMGKLREQEITLKNQIHALQSRVDILSEAQVDAVASRSSRYMFDKNKVIIPRDDYEKLIRTARGAERSMEITWKLSMGQEQARWDSEKIISESKKQADKILQDATENAAQIKEEYYQLDSQKARLISEINRLEKREDELRSVRTNLDELRMEYDSIRKSLRNEIYKRRFVDVDQLPRNINHFSLRNRGLLVALYKDGTVRKVGTNETGGYDYQTIYDARDGLCRVGVFQNERSVDIPETLFKELLLSLDKNVQLSERLRNLINREQNLTKSEKKIPKETEIER